VLFGAFEIDPANAGKETTMVKNQQVNKYQDEHDQSIGPSHIVGDSSLEARIAEQVNHAARVRESMAHLRHCKTDLQSATERRVLKYVIRADENNAESRKEKS
jgi:hypothetical protein